MKQRTKDIIFAIIVFTWIPLMTFGFIWAGWYGTYLSEQEAIERAKEEQSNGGKQ